MKNFTCSNAPVCHSIEGGLRRQRGMVLGASSLAIAAVLTTQPSWAQDCTSIDNGICTIVVAQDDTNVTVQQPSVVVNQADGTDISKPTHYQYFVLRNEAGASIDTITISPPTTFPPTGFVRLGNAVFNAGTIQGDLILPANSIYVNQGGTVGGNFGTFNGNATFGTQQFGSGNNTQTFIDRAGTGVGNFDPGNGIDGYVTSYGSGTFTHTLSSQLPTNFEVGGVELRGADSTAIIVNDGLAIPYGLTTWGTGTVVNRATINPISTFGTGIPQGQLGAIAVNYGGDVGNNGVLIIDFFDPAVNQLRFLTFGYGSALEGFANEGTINGDITIRTASFSNDGDINLRGTNTVIFTAADRDFSFTNSGNIIANNLLLPFGTPVTDNAVTLVSALDSTQLAAVDIDNSGLIEGGLSFAGFASDFVFDNSGTITMEGNPIGIERAVTLEVGSIELPFGNYTIPDGLLVVT